LGLSGSGGSRVVVVTPGLFRVGLGGLGNTHAGSAGTPSSAPPCPPRGAGTCRQPLPRPVSRRRRQRGGHGGGRAGGGGVGAGGVRLRVPSQGRDLGLHQAQRALRPAEADQPPLVARPEERGHPALLHPCPVREGAAPHRHPGPARPPAAGARRDGPGHARPAAAPGLRVPVRRCHRGGGAGRTMLGDPQGLGDLERLGDPEGHGDPERHGDPEGHGHPEGLGAQEGLGDPEGLGAQEGLGDLEGLATSTQLFLAPPGAEPPPCRARSPIALPG